MKKIRLILAIFLCFYFLSCEKHENETMYCANVIQNSPENTQLSESEMKIITYLFDRNQLDHTNYLFTRYQKSELGYQTVRCEQFVNDLLVFTGEVIFKFDKNDNYCALYGDLVNDVINLDATYKQKQSRMIEKYIDLVMDDKYALIRLEVQTEITEMDERAKALCLEKISGKCIDVEYGYFDVNSGESYADKKFTKAWKFNFKNYDYPVAYFDDKNSKLIYYFNGLIMN